VSQRSASAFARQVRSQPEQLERVLLATDARVRTAVEGLHRRHRIWLVGTGTSQHAAELGAMMLQEAGRSAQAVPSMRFVEWAPVLGPKDGIIAITHTAETAYTLSAIAQARAAGLEVMAITRRGAALADAIETVDRETSQTHSVSYTAALLVLARIAGELGAESLSREAVTEVIPAVARAIDEPGIDSIPDDPRLLLIFGAGPAWVTAREGALKCREAARLLAEGYDSEYLLHGSAVPLGTKDRLVALETPDPGGFTGAVSRAAEREGTPVTTLRETAPLHPLLAQIPLTVRLQLLALRLAERRRHDPDVVLTGAWTDPALWRLGQPPGA
jgi:glucosamine--fructose-6-phosphate aminotransferase (isomerizing)